MIAEAFERLEAGDPHVPDLVTQGHRRESELRLQKEIAQVRADSTVQLEQPRGEVKTAIERSRNRLLLGLMPLMFVQVGAIAALVKLL